MIGELDQLGHRGVVAQVRVVLPNALDGLVEQTIGVVGQRFFGDPHVAGRLVDHQAPRPLEESLGAHHVFGRPGAGGVERTHRHLVNTQGVGAVLAADVIGRNGILERLAHFPVLAVDFLTLVEELATFFGDLLGRDVDAPRIGERVRLDHSLVVETAVRFCRGDVSEVEQHLVPEARVQQVQHGVLHAADVEVEATGVLRSVQLGTRAHPIGLVLLGAQLFRVLRIDVAQLIPGAARPLRHHVGVARVVLETIPEIEFDMHPIGGLGQRRRRLTVSIVRVERDWRIIDHVGQLDRQHRIRDRMRRAVLVVDDGEGLAPVALPGEQPIAQFVLDRPAAGTIGLEPLDDRRLGVLHRHPVEESGVHQRSVTRVRLLGDTLFRTDNLDDLQTERRRELVVAGVVGRHRHDGAGAVTDEHVVGDEDRDLLSVDRIRRVAAGEDTGLLFVLLALQVGFGRDGLPVLRDRGCGSRGTEGPQRVDVCRPGSSGELVDQLVFGREHHVRGSEKRVGPGGEHLDLVIGAGHTERHLSTARTADPVALHGLDLLGPVQQLEVVEEAIAVGGDAHHPLAQAFTEDREVAAVAATVRGDLFVRQHSSQPGTPVDE